MLARDTGVFKDTQTLLKIVCDITFLFPKQLKHTLGQEAIKSCIEMLSCIQMINVSPNEKRMEWFDEFIVYEERLRAMMEVGMDYDFSKIGTRRIAVYTDLINKIGKQMSGWRKSSQSHKN